MAFHSARVLGFCAVVMLAALAGSCYSYDVGVGVEVGLNVGLDQSYDNNKGAYQNGDYKYNKGLKLNFYGENCSTAEFWVKNITVEGVRAERGLAAELLRLHFHDCFVRGCDASVLLDFTPTNQNQTEKVALPNLSLGGFEVIEKIKAKLEEVCPNVVSCADILTLSARDAVNELEPKAWWEVETGRRDGKVSNDTEASENLPSSLASFDILKSNFASKGLNVTDLVALSGAHTIGTAHCGTISTRLYNFSGNGDTDPKLNSVYAKTLKNICPQNTNFQKEVDMDENSGESFDTHYFDLVEENKGIFQSDAALLDDDFSSFLVKDVLQNQDKFFKQFGISMIKMGRIGVLTGEEGEIRETCSITK